jgi:large subunit ribosomal protein L15
MKLHDLRPAPGSHTKKRRVGRGIAAGQGKTAGRGTKGQKARAGGSIPAWFEGGQTPLHQRIPKLHGFRNPFRIEYEVVNLGAIAHLVELGVLEPGEMPGTAPKRAKAAAAPVTVNQEILRAAGLVRTLDKPMKVLGSGEIGTALFVVADAFSASAKAKIEAAGGSVSVLEVPTKKVRALGPEVSGAEATTASTEPQEAPVEAAPSTTTEPAVTGPASEPEVASSEPEAASSEPEPVSEPEATAEATAPPADDAVATTKPAKPRARRAKAPAPDSEG